MSMWLGEPGVEKEFEQLPRKEGRQGQPRERLQTNRRIFSKYFFKIEGFTILDITFRMFSTTLTRRDAVSLNVYADHFSSLASLSSFAVI
ncbi:unnamed protein product [Brugia pahangi]|uniref:Uncharacterized protein n=1 Tax=Brugia pahangi TaxID=6280 RepID=A0A0N4TVY4_BRUPA|nr:unnamed protein product [Brugia pahangi]